MKTFFEAIILLLIIKGLLYVFFPVWIQRFVAENIINLPIPRLKAFGILMIFLGIVLWVAVANKLS